MSELIASNYLDKLNEIQESRREERKTGKVNKTAQAKLIGHAGYEEMFDD